MFTLVKDMVLCRLPVTTAMNVRVPLELEHFSTSEWLSVFSRNILCRITAIVVEE